MPGMPASDPDGAGHPGSRYPYFEQRAKTSLHPGSVCLAYRRIGARGPPLLEWHMFKRQVGAAGRNDSRYLVEQAVMAKQVYVTGNLADAYAVRGPLWGVGIYAIIRGRDLSAMRDLQMKQDSPFSLWVDDPDAEQAQQTVGRLSA